MANPGLLVGKFIEGFIKGKEKKKKKDIAAQKAQNKITEDSYKAEVEYWKEIVSQSGENTEVKEYAQDMLMYVKGIKAGKNVFKPNISPAVESFLSGVSGDMDVESMFNPAKMDEGSDVRKKYDKATEIVKRWDTYYNNLKPTDKEKVNEKLIVQGLKFPTIETVMGELDNYDATISALTGQKVAYQSELEAEKEDLSRLKPVTDEYKGGLKESIENDLAEIEALKKVELKRAELKEQFDIDDATFEALQAINLLKKTNITKLADDKTVESLIKKLMIYKELNNGVNYNVSDAVWDTPLLKETASKNLDLDVNTADALLGSVYGGEDSITLKEYMQGFYLPADSPTGRGGELVSASYESLKTIYPEVYEHIDIISKEATDVANIEKKRDGVLKELSRMRSSLFNLNFAKLGYEPAIDNREKIIDNREFIINSDTKEQEKNENYLKEIDNPGIGTPLMSFPYYQDFSIKKDDEEES
tara:strand:+ start:83 stop:1507 length:1425 start_codon:yes stop_codon:yes gene_type:complete